MFVPVDLALLGYGCFEDSRTTRSLHIRPRISSYQVNISHTAERCILNLRGIYSYTQIIHIKEHLTQEYIENSGFPSHSEFSNYSNTITVSNNSQVIYVRKIQIQRKFKIHLSMHIYSLTLKQITYHFFIHIHVLTLHV